MMTDKVETLRGASLYPSPDQYKKGHLLTNDMYDNILDFSPQQLNIMYQLQTQDPILKNDLKNANSTYQSRS